MKRDPCSLCGEPIETASRTLCPGCIEMEKKIDALVEKRPKQMRAFLVAKYNAAIYCDPRIKDRRTKPYNPPWGKHTPERRKRIRRRDAAPESPKRRKTDN